MKMSLPVPEGDHWFQAEGKNKIFGGLNNTEVKLEHNGHGRE